MQKYLPSKQFVKIMSITLSVGLAFFLLGKIFENKTFSANDKVTKDSSNKKAENEDFFDQDTDGDGLYDWEEALWGTDPRQKDSDDDGIDDKKYVENKRKTADFDETYKPDTSNETETFARQLFTTAAVLNQSGTFNKDTIEQFSQGVNSSISNFNLKDKYTLSNLKLSSVSATDYYKNYKKMYDSLPAKDVSEIEVIVRLAENPNDQQGLEDLAKLNVMFDKFKSSLLSMEVPYAISGVHLSIINNLDKFSSVVTEARNLEKDPLKTITYLSKYEEYSDDLTSNYETLYLYFDENVIIE